VVLATVAVLGGVASGPSTAWGAAPATAPAAAAAAAGGAGAAFSPRRDLAPDQGIVPAARGRVSGAAPAGDDLRGESRRSRDLAGAGVALTAVALALLARRCFVPAWSGIGVRCVAFHGCRAPPG
jgi:hypothetical protein